MIKKLLTINKKGITITSLTIYVIVATIIVGILVFLNANFFSNINDLTDKANIVSECLDFKSAFIRDLKSENDMKVTDYNNNLIRLSNNVKYEIRVLDKNAEDKKYAIYRNDVQIAKSIVSHTVIDGQKVKEGPFFEYDVTNNTVKVGIKFFDGKNSYIESGTYIVGKQVKVSWENSVDNLYNPPTSGEGIPENPTVPESDRIYAALYSDGTLMIGNTNLVDSSKTLLSNYGEISNSISDGNPTWLKDKSTIKVVNFTENVKIANLENLFNGCSNMTIMLVILKL